MTGASRRETGPQHGEALADPLQRGGVCHLAQAQIELLRALARFAEQPLLGPFERQPLLVEERLDPTHEIEVALTVETLTRRVLLRPEELELRLPVAQHVRGHGRDRLDLADPVVQLLDGVRVGRHAPGVGVYALMLCFKPLLGLNVRTFRAVISMLSPVCGFRPRREALRRIRKWPKPTIFTSSPFSKQRKMMSKTDSTTADDWRFDNPWLATAFTRSFFVTGASHPLPR